MNLIRLTRLFGCILILSLVTEHILLAQDLATEIMAKLPKSDQIKILKANQETNKGNEILSKVLADTVYVLDTAHYDKNYKILTKYYSERLKASYCFKNANGMWFGVFQKQSKSFWHKYKNDKNLLENIVQVEKSTLIPFTKQTIYREKAENSMYIDDKVPLLIHAERIETEALIKLREVLYVYLNWPQQPDMVWFYSEKDSVPHETISTAFVKPSKDSILSEKQDSTGLKPDTIAKDTIQLAKETNYQKEPSGIQS